MIMIREQTVGTVSAGGIDSRATVDFYIAVLSDKDINVRQRSVVALGVSRDSRAVEPLMFALSREISLGAESFVIVMDIVEALYALTAVFLSQMLKIESQRSTWLPDCKEFADRAPSSTAR
jgi:HEAT repeat protein